MPASPAKAQADSQEEDLDRYLDNTYLFGSIIALPQTVHQTVSWFEQHLTARKTLDDIKTVCIGAPERIANVSA